MSLLPPPAKAPSQYTLEVGVGQAGFITVTACLYLCRQGLALAQAGLRLLASSDPPTSASQSIGITDVSHRTWPFLVSRVDACANFFLSNICI